MKKDKRKSLCKPSYNANNYAINICGERINTFPTYVNIIKLDY